MSKRIFTLLMALFAVTLSGLTGCGGGSSNAPNNKATAAVAGLAQNVVAGSVVALDGSQSTGADGNLISYKWVMETKPAGSTAVIVNPADVNPTFTADVAGQYTLGLSVSDTKSTSYSELIVTATGPGANAVPVAQAGTAQSVKIGTFVTLDGSASSDANGDLLTYRWVLSSVPAGSGAVLSDATAALPSFIADVSGVYVVSLVVNDGTSSSDTAVVTIAASGENENAKPVANAGDAQSVIRGALVALNGSGSSDANGDPLKYSWSFTSKPAGSSAALSSATVVSPTFRADVAGSYVLNLVVNDGETNSAAAVVTITASDSNAAPVAYAGFNRTVVTGTQVMLDGSTSSDANSDKLTYNWAFSSKPEGSASNLTSTTDAKPLFTADVSGDYVVRLVVYDGKVYSAAITVTLTASPFDTTPVANAGSAARSVTVGTVVKLDGSNSDDADGSLLTYSWELTTHPAGSAAQLSSTTAPGPSFTADKVGEYRVTLTVSDVHQVRSLPVTVVITAVDPYLELSRVGYNGDDILALPYSQSDVLTPATTTLASFKLAAFGANYTVSNIVVDSGSPLITASISGLSNGQAITAGNQARFYLLASPVNGPTAIVDYSFTVTEAGAASGKTFAYHASLTAR